MKSETDQFSIYELSINARVTWQAHSLSNVGDNGSNRLLPRRQFLADGTETDACSGSILKHHHAAQLARYFEALGCPLCPACHVRDSRRAGALADRPEYAAMTMERILNECALCDAHGFLVTAKHAAEGEAAEARQRLYKQTLIDFSYALALPERHREVVQLHVRAGASKQEGQMLMKRPARSGDYALCIRYRSAGIGVDTERWRLVVESEQERAKRHGAILQALRDTLLSPMGALTATMLPHLAGLVGAIVVSRTVRLAPVYSPLDEAFIARLQAMGDEDCRIYPFETAEAFYALMRDLIALSTPATPPSWKGASLWESPRNNA